MAQVVSELPYTLESSTQLTRPDAKIFVRPDTNAGETEISQYALYRSRTQLNLPKSNGPPDYRIDCCENKFSSRSSIKPAAILTKRQNKIELNVIDPITGFLSSTGECLLQVQERMPSFGKASLEPQCVVPQDLNSIRIKPEAIDELKRVKEGEAEPELKWNSTKVSENAIKSRLGGWCSVYDSRGLTRSNVENPFRLKDIFPNMKITLSNEERDQLAKKYRFRTSTQEMYEQIDWDSKLPKKLHAPVSTYEHGKADPLMKRSTTSISPELAKKIIKTNLKKLVKSTWDRSQYRNSNFTREPVAFTAPTKRANQLPGYSGYISGYKIDDVISTHKPLTLVRTNQPKETNPNYAPNIPGYTGKYHFTKTTSVSHYDNSGRPYTTTAAFHRSFSDIEKEPTKIASLLGDFARIQTKVPPQNPFD